MNRSDRTVLITGASGGIGREIALRFLKERWNILCHYNSSDTKARELIKLLDKQNSRHCLFKVDFSSRKQVYSFINTVSKFNVDCLINNAGSYVVCKHFSVSTLADIENIFMVNVFTPILLSSRIFMQMKKRNFGRIVNISSIAAKYGGSAFSMYYGCSKLAMEGAAKTLSKEGAQYNVLVNTIRPGVIDTGFHRTFPKDMKKRAEMIPLKRIGVPQDIADMAYYLGSGENNFITNEIITVSGGE